MVVSLVTPPSLEPISLAEAKAHVSAVGTDLDLQLNAWITVARITVERLAGLKLITQTWDCAFDAFPSCGAPIVLPLAPLLTVASVTWYDDSDVGTVVNAATYAVDAMSSRPRIALRQGQAWPSAVLRPVNGVVVRASFGCGPSAGDVTKVAAPLRAAMLLLIGHLEAHPEAVVDGAVTELPLGFDALVSCCRRELLA